MEELKKACFSLNLTKALGPDGYTTRFFQKQLDLIKRDLFQATSKFFNSGFLLSKLNRSNVVLIPKIAKPELISQFRPISLCNVAYKIISKVLVLRLKCYLNLLISQNQNAFMPGRMIHDNIVVAHETFHFLKKKRKGRTRC